MHPLRLTLALVAAFATHALAAPIDVTKGFAGAMWGMSPAEVAKATGAVDAGYQPVQYSQPVTPLSGVPVVILVKQSDDGQLSTFYVCYDGKLAEIVRGANLETFCAKADDIVTSSFKSDGSISIVSAMNFTPSFFPPGHFESFKLKPYNLVFSLVCQPIENAITKASEDKFKTQSLPKLLE